MQHRDQGLTDEQLVELFTYHAPSEEQRVRYSQLRAAALDFARAIVALTRPCADQTAAVRKVREAVMTANAAVALEQPAG